MSKREEVRLRQKRRAQFQTVFVAILAVVAVAVVGYLVYQGLQSGIGLTPASAYDPNRSLGPAGAKVVIQEFSDFQ